MSKKNLRYLLAYLLMVVLVSGAVCWILLLSPSMWSNQVMVGIPNAIQTTGEVEDKKYRIKETDNKDFWLPILTSKSFYDFM
jgi:uncharacterized RDD family membrane protein YckC